MRYLLSAGGTFLLAWTVRFITGSLAGLCTLFIVLVFSIAMDGRPMMFLMLSFLLSVLVRYGDRHHLLVMNAVPLLSGVVLVFLRLSIVPVIGLLLANGITLISLAYRGWANKRLLD